MYLQAVLNAKEKPTKALSEAFRSLFLHLSHEDFKGVVIPSSVKMLKRNPELVLEAIGVLFRHVNLDLSKYSAEILPVVLSQARHADEGRRLAALDIVRYLSQKSSNPDAIESMANAVKSIIGGSEGRLAFPYQRVGMIHSLQELSKCPEGKYLSSLSLSVCGLLLTTYKDDGGSSCCFYFSLDLGFVPYSCLCLIFLIDKSINNVAIWSHLPLNGLILLHYLLRVGKIKKSFVRVQVYTQFIQPFNSFYFRLSLE